MSTDTKTPYLSIDAYAKQVGVTGPAVRDRLKKGHFQKEDLLEMAGHNYISAHAAYPARNKPGKQAAAPAETPALPTEELVTKGKLNFTTKGL